MSAQTKQNYIETISYNRKLQEFQIKREYRKSHEIENRPLSEWGFTKSVENCFVIICRQVETLELETPSKMIYYKLPISYNINELGKFWYFKTELSSNPDDPFERKFLTICLKDVSSGVGFQAPFPNSLYRGEYPFLVMQKGKSVKIDAKEIEKLLTEEPYRCLGIFDFSLQNRIINPS